MENNNSDQHIKGKFDSHEISVNTTELWNNIVPHIKPAKSNKRKLIIFLLLGLFGVSTIIYGYKSVLPLHHISQENTSIQNELKENTEIKETSKPIEFSTVNTEMTEAETTLSNGSVSNTEPNNSTVEHLSTSEQSLKTKPLGSSKSSELGKITSANLDNRSSVPTVLTEEIIRETMNQATIPVRVSHDDSEEDKVENLFTRASLEIGALAKTSIPFLPINRMHSSPDLKLNQEQTIPAKYLIYLGASAGISKPKMILKASVQEHQEYTNQRISFEKPLESYFTYAHADLRLPKWWSFSFGAAYTEQHYSSEHTITYLEDFNYQDITIEIIQAQNGQQSEIKGNMLGKKEINVSGIRYHSYRNFSARTDVGIWKSWKKHTIHAKLGYSFPLITMHTGFMYDTPSSDYDLNMDLEKRIKKASTYHAGINYEFELLNQHKITLGSYFSYEENIFSIDSRVNQMQRSLGLQVGYLIKI